ncbi:uncharacterized protein K452DRAFT_358843 [Aplosporella prunicola CBS 121167]|uniref:Uncharacterized protein n=1 Tax=Aplosporella prunicola CBS 121167 TaxID=1176127 RepID=A0A6A6BFQ1_9PEZI|nr:uncharacterized protein K452DRAFT_358843 [Aplosporella prunicola CBS 121167]KAF2141747.1 hypothetical protein K452DRAFT_358843 [Aplosporella prunicola CBS 121167]
MASVDTTTIPLNCNICPKKPSFSDVSHLLTHIASKGHLSHYYRCKVRAASETDARECLENYDRWYADWKVEKLMSERMSAKDKKRSRTKSSINVEPDATRSKPSSARPTQADDLRRRAINSLDPRLSAPPVKDEPSPTPPPMLGDTFSYHTYPRMTSSWPSPHTASTDTTLTTPGMDGSDVFTESTDTFERKLTSPSPFSTLGESTLAEADVDMRDPMAVSEASKLKGVYWPGMDIFDSATPEMKRKRNQKKDTSVLEQLEENSREVEPNEMVFTPFGSLYKSKTISGSDTSSSPIKLDASPKCPRLNRAALLDLDLNQPRSRRRKSPRKRRVQETYGDEDLELELTLGTVRTQKKKRGLVPFRDDEQADEVTFGRPASFSMLTAPFHPQPDPTMQFDFGKTYADAFQMSYDTAGLDFNVATPTYFSSNLPAPNYLQQNLHNDMSAFFNSQFSLTGQSWTGTSFQLPDAQPNVEAEPDEKPQYQHDVDDEATIAAPPSDGDLQ